MKKQSATKKSAAKNPTKRGGSALSPPADSGTPRGHRAGHRYKFCFIIPSYAGKRNAQGERHPGPILALGRCLDSIAGQTDPDCRVMLINDGHALEMRRLAQEFQAATPHIPIQYIEAPYRGERGGHVSVNLALSVLPDDCEFVAIVNGDNTLRPQYIEKMYSPEHDILLCMVKMHDQPGIVLTGETFERRVIDRLNYAVRASIARATKHKTHMDADCDFLIDCAAMSENGYHHAQEILADHY